MTRWLHPLEAWTGTFGDAYIERNLADDARLRQGIVMWRQVLRPLAAQPPQAVSKSAQMLAST